MQLRAVALYYWVSSLCSSQNIIGNSFRYLLGFYGLGRMEMGRFHVLLGMHGDTVSVLGWKLTATTLVPSPSEIEQR